MLKFIPPSSLVRGRIYPRSAVLRWKKPSFSQRKKSLLIGWRIIEPMPASFGWDTTKKRHWSPKSNLVSIRWCSPLFWLDRRRAKVHRCAKLQNSLHPTKPKKCLERGQRQKKVEKLIKLGKMKPEGLQLYNIRKDKEGYTSNSKCMPLDPKFEEQLRANGTAWAYFSTLAPSYKRDSIWWVMSAKKRKKHAWNGSQFCSTQLHWVKKNPDAA